MENSKTFLREAIAIAAENASGTEGGPFGAVIVKENIIIARGANTVTSANDPTAHAEVNAIREACKSVKNFNLEGCTLYTSCEPCPMCLSAAYWAGIKKIYFAAGRDDASEAGFSDSFIYEQIPLPPSKRDIKMEQILENEGKEPFEKWLSNNKRVDY